MLSEPRLYQGENDLESMRSVLRAGRLANNGTYYVHPGDLSWWLFYPQLDYDFWRSIYLWDDPAEPGKLLAWALLSPVGQTFDVVLQPWLRGTSLAWEMYSWALKRLTAIARVAGRDHLSVYWIAEDDALLNGWLGERGFVIKNRDVHLACNLADVQPAGTRLSGFIVRGSYATAEVRERALAQYGAFEGSADFERYVQRFTRFMQSPVYDPELDVVAADPGGQIGAFCLIWPDTPTGVGLFEPVGTHPDFQRRGLGKAVMLEGLERLRRRGMRQAIVTTDGDNLPAIRLYESVGFCFNRRLQCYELKI